MDERLVGGRAVGHESSAGPLILEHSYANALEVQIHTFYPNSANPAYRGDGSITFHSIPAVSMRFSQCQG